MGGPVNRGVGPDIHHRSGKWRLPNTLEREVLMLDAESWPHTSYRRNSEAPVTVHTVA
jgi:hypothetical protein